jgi:hypothetical protein
MVVPVRWWKEPENLDDDCYRAATGRLFGI